MHNCGELPKRWSKLLNQELRNYNSIAGDILQKFMAVKTATHATCFTHYCFQLS